MCPPAPVPPPADISVYWTDGELFMLLDKITSGSPLPRNVFADVNPYLYMPSNLPDDFWYFIHSEEKKDSELGSWKTKGEACEIFVDSDIIGWRTTLEFYEGRAPHGQKTDWVMQEYRITCKRLCENKQQKESGSLCRVFLSGVQSSNQEMHHKQVGAGSAGGNLLHSMPSVVPNADNTSGQGSLSEFQVKNRDEKTGQLTVAESLQNLPVEDLHENDYILRGDYMALDDLSSSSDYILRGDYMALDDLSSSSDNSSRVSLSSDECFDSLALLRDLEDEINQNRQGNDANVKFSVAESARSKEVVMSPATSGSLISSNGSKSPTEETLKTGCSPPGSAVKGKVPGERALKHEVKSKKTDHRREGASNYHSQKMDHRREGTSNYHNVAASSSSHKSVLESRMKKLKTYLCFMPF